VYESFSPSNNEPQRATLVVVRWKCRKTTSTFDVRKGALAPYVRVLPWWTFDLLQAPLIPLTMGRGLSRRLLPVLGWGDPVGRTPVTPPQLWWPPQLSHTGSTQPLRWPWHHQVLAPRPRWRPHVSSSTTIEARTLHHRQQSSGVTTSTSSSLVQSTCHLVAISR
jgi:hypothetical protein